MDSSSFIQNQAAAANGLWLIVLAPLAGALVNGLFGRRLGRANVALIACGAIAASFLAGLVGFVWAFRGATLHFAGPVWFEIPHVAGPPLLSIHFGLLLDRLSGSLVLIITGVGFLIHLYSVAYMEHEPEFGYARYFTYLNLFAGAMLILVLGDSLVMTFMGWEGVGLCSYLLIGFWYKDPQKAYAGRKAFVANRVGDFGFVLGIFSLLALFGTASYADLGRATLGFNPAFAVTAGTFAGWTAGAALTFACLMLFLGCTGKSAQLPLYVWLPDAMAGPTPVSALIHAATMVTAGVYLIARLSFLFALSPVAMATVTIVGTATALLAAVIALAQDDIKKVLAYSTVSQLGYMFVGVGVGAWAAGVMHLITHAFFKACLFLGAGSVMHGMGDETDVQKMGGLWKKMPSTAWTFGIATLAITGVVPLSGFFSKDAILAGAFQSENAALPWVGKLAWGFGTLTAFLTAFYMTRLFALTFAGKPRTRAAEHAHESKKTMTFPLWVLAILAVLAAALGLPKLEALGGLGELFQEFMHGTFAQASRLLGGGGAEEGAALWPYAVALVVAWAGAGLAWLMYAGSLAGLPDRIAAALPRTYALVKDKLRVDELYELLVLQPVKLLAQMLWRVVDFFAIDKVFVNGVPRTVAFTGNVVRVLQNGDVQRYAAAMAVAAAVILWAVLGS